MAKNSSTEASSLDLLNQIKKFMKENQDNLDFDKIQKELMQCYQKLQGLFKVDEKMIQFFKVSFQNKTTITNFIEERFHMKVPKTSRKGLNELAASLTMGIHFDKERMIQDKIFKKHCKPNSLIKSPSTKKKSKKSDAGKSKQKKLKTPISQTHKDKSLEWIFLSKTELLRELGNMVKYPDSRSLKQAAKKLLKSDDLRIQSRKLLMQRIIYRIEESNALSRIGK